MFLDQHLLDWWTETGLGRSPGFDYEVSVTEFSQFVKVGYVQSIFSNVESSLRTFLRGVDPVACSGGTAEFQSVYRALLQTKLGAPDPHHLELLDLWRTLRNTVHNNGVYFHRSGGSSTVGYKGVTYDFTHGRAVEFAKWPVLVSLTGDLVDLLIFITGSSVLANVSPPLTDPYSS